jgi:PAS domain S-box-containing protein
VVVVKRPRDAPDLDRLLAHTADGACAIDGDGRIVFWNQAAERIMGHPTREVIGRLCCEVFVGRDVAGNRLCYQGCHVMTLVTRGEVVQHFEMATRTKAGKPLWLDISIVIVPGRRPDLTTTVHLFRDVTTVHEIDALVRERLAHAVCPPAGTPAVDLTRREREILRHLVGGANTAAIAERLCVSRATVRNHVQNLLGKLGVHSRLEAAAYATRHGLL